MKNKYNVVTIGGGTGTYAVLSGLKKYSELNLTALVAVTDDGGSSGKLRDEFGFLPAGDLRQCIAALAEEGNGNNLMRKLFSYRFQKGGSGLEGHSLGNLLITAMTDISQDQRQAIEDISKILKIKGRVIPISTDNITLAVKRKNGHVTVGESNIKDRTILENQQSPITEIWHQPEAGATDSAIHAIKNSDFIIIGPGGLYTSIITNLLIKGIKDTIKESKSKIIYNMNLMTDSSQTYNYTAQDHLDVLEKFLGQRIDIIILNNQKLNPRLLRKYKKYNDVQVVDDLRHTGRTIVRGDLITGSREIGKKKDFGAKRSLIRHNSRRLAEKLYKIISES